MLSKNFSLKKFQQKKKKLKKKTFFFSKKLKKEVFRSFRKYRYSKNILLHALQKKLQKNILNEIKNPKYYLKPCYLRNFEKKKTVQLKKRRLLL